MSNEAVMASPMPMDYTPKKFVNLTVEVDSIPDLMEVMASISTYGKVTRISYDNY